MYTIESRSTQRKRVIAAIHVAKAHARMCPEHRRLQFDERCIICGNEAPHLSDDLYRDLLRRGTSKSSCSDMNDAELKFILTVFQNAGFKPKRRRMDEMIARSRNGMARGIEKMAPDILGENWEHRLSGYVRKRFGKDSVRFLNIKELQSVYGFLRGVERDQNKEREGQNGDDHRTAGHGEQGESKILTFPGSCARDRAEINQDDEEDEV